MKTAFGRMNSNAYLWLTVFGLICASSIGQTAKTLAKAETANDKKQVKILATGVELIEITDSAPKCGKQKGQTIRLKVTSESPVDVRLYVHTSWKQWMEKDFPNQKHGDEISDYRCGPATDYKVYAHAVGSSEPWPKP